MPASSTVSLPHKERISEWKQLLRQKRCRYAIRGGLLCLFVLLAARCCAIHPNSFSAEMRRGLNVIELFFPPDWQALPTMMQPIAVTFALALAGTIVGTILSVPCALAASANIAPAWLRYTARSLITLERGLPEIILLLLLIAAFGLGALPGLIALSISSIGMLAKLLADTIEEVEPQVLESVAVTGATRSQVIRYAVIPQLLPALVANSLFRFEVNVRASVLLGAVGAGGIGYELSTAMSSLEYRRATAAILLSLALVLVSERISDFFRARILLGGHLR